MTNKYKPQKSYGLNEPLLHTDHSAPKTRRDFLRQGFISGTGSVLGGSIFSLFANPQAAMASVSSDLLGLADDIRPNEANVSDVCKIGEVTGGKIPFICFDLAGGANIAGSNVIVGQGLGQENFLSTAGYSKMGLPGDIIPGLSDTTLASTMRNASDGNFVNSQLGLKFHSDSAMLTGILEKFTSVAPGLVDGAVIPARSDNDTGNNTHNPMYGIAKAGAVGGVATLIGSRSSESGGNSMAPPMLIDPTLRPTKVDRPSDVTGMVDVGDLTAILSSPEDVTAVMESMARISHKKIKQSAPNINATKDEVIRDLIRCGYLKSTDIADRFAGREVNPDDRNATITPPEIVSDNGGIFTEAEFDGESEFRKTASVMKMVIDGHAGAGTITMGGFDYHTGDRSTGEARDLRAGRCIGACLEYAAKRNTKLMIYVYSDGSVASNGILDNSVGGRGKGNWTGDNSSTACSYFLVFNPNGNITTFADTGLIDPRQIGSYSINGSVVTSATPAANNVNLLVNTVLANYMALNGDIANFATTFPNHGLGDYEKMVSFNPLV